MGGARVTVTATGVGRRRVLRGAQVGSTEEEEEEEEEEEGRGTDRSASDQRLCDRVRKAPVKGWRRGPPTPGFRTPARGRGTGRLALVSTRSEEGGFCSCRLLWACRAS